MSNVKCKVFDTEEEATEFYLAKMKLNKWVRYVADPFPDSGKQVVEYLDSDDEFKYLT